MVEQRGGVAVALGRGQHGAQDDVVVAAVVHGLGAALEPGQGAVEQRGAGDARGGAGSGRAGPTSGRPLVANQSAARRPDVDRTETAQVPDSSTASRNRASLSTQTSTRTGSSETEVKALAVIAWSKVPTRVVATVTPGREVPDGAPERRLVGRREVGRLRRGGAGTGTDIASDTTRRNEPRTPGADVERAVPGGQTCTAPARRALLITTAAGCSTRRSVLSDASPKAFLVALDSARQPTTRPPARSGIDRKVAIRPSSSCAEVTVRVGDPRHQVVHHHGYAGHLGGGVGDRAEELGVLLLRGRRGRR